MGKPSREMREEYDDRKMRMSKWGTVEGMTKREEEEKVSPSSQASIMRSEKDCLFWTEARFFSFLPFFERCILEVIVWVRTTMTRLFDGRADGRSVIYVSFWHLRLHRPRSVWKDVGLWLIANFHQSLNMKKNTKCLVR